MDSSRQTIALKSRLSRRTLILNYLLAAVLFVACSRSSQSEVFTDEVSGFAVIKPAGWFMQSGVVLKARARDEARRFKDDPQLGPRPDGSPVQALTRITRYEPGKAPGTNPTIVFVRFDLHQFPPSTNPDDLLKMGVATANPEGEAVTVTLGGRPWRKLIATRLLTDLAGQQVAVRQEVYVLIGDPWGTGVTISALPQQFTEYRAAFDRMLQTASLK